MPYLLLALEILDQVLVAPDEKLFDFVAEGLLRVDQAEDTETALKVFLHGLLAGLGGEVETSLLDWSGLEARFAALVPGWRPLRTLSMLSNLSLPLYDGEL